MCTTLQIKTLELYAMTLSSSSVHHVAMQDVWIALAQSLYDTSDEKCSRATCPNTSIMEWLLLLLLIIAPWNIWIHLALDLMQAGHACCLS